MSIQILTERIFRLRFCFWQRMKVCCLFRCWFWFRIAFDNLRCRHISSSSNLTVRTCTLLENCKTNLNLKYKWHRRNIDNGLTLNLWWLYSLHKKLWHSSLLHFQSQKNKNRNINCITSDRRTPDLKIGVDSDISRRWNIESKCPGRISRRN